MISELKDTFSELSDILCTCLFVVSADMRKYYVWDFMQWYSYAYVYVSLWFMRIL